MKRRYSLSRKDYTQKSIDKGLIRTIEKMQQWLQIQENKKNGKKAQEVTFVFASKELNKMFKAMRRFV